MPVAQKKLLKARQVVLQPQEADELKNQDFHMKHAYALRETFYQVGDLFAPTEYILTYLTKKKHIGELRLTIADCHHTIWRYVQFLLSKDYYQPAAIVLWGPDMFTPEPDCTQRVWRALRSHTKNLIMGGGSLSKSYSGSVYYGLDYIRDPEWTCIKVMSATREHAKRNLFGHMRQLLKNTIVPIPNLDIKAESIQVNDNDKQGIHLVTIPQGDDGKGRLRGFHPEPRGSDHPQFGKLSRIRVILDEAEEVPEGVWKEIDNILLTQTEDDSHVEIFAATNPTDRTSKFGEKAEPVDGWASLDIDESMEWESEAGWHVTRLDGARCENVIEKRMVYEGLQTFEGFTELLRKGTNDPTYMTMGRGWFPEASAATVIITEKMFDAAKGIYTYTGPTVNWASVDNAFEGNDSVLLTTGRQGEALGWTSPNGRWFNFKVPRRCVQVEQQFTLEKKDTLEQAKAIMKLCKSLKITPAWLAVDRTGNGTGIHDCLKSLYGPQVLGIMWSWAATDMKILVDDTSIASEEYHDIISEMAFALRRFIETDTVKFNPGIKWNDLEKEMTTRKYRQVGRGFKRIESKDEYKKKHGGKSPDRFDSCIMGIHLVRCNTDITAAQVENPVQTRTPRIEPQHGVVDALEFIDMS